MILEKQEILIPLISTQNLNDFNLHVRVFFDTLFREIAHHLLRSPPQGRASLPGYVQDLLLGPIALVELLFDQDLNDRSPEAVRIGHDSLSRPILGLHFLSNAKEFAQIPTSRLAAYFGIQRDSRNLYERVLLSIFAVSLSAAQKGIRIEIEIPEDVHLRSGIDFETFDQTLSELFNNTLKYNDPNKGDRYIRIRLEQSLIVEDNGRGIRDTEAVWARGVRESTEHGDLINGSGLGLAIVKERIERLGGKITLESVQGEWTRFKIRLADGNLQFPKLRPAARRTSMKLGYPEGPLPENLADLGLALLDGRRGAREALERIARSDATLAASAQTILDHRNTLQKMKHAPGPYSFAACVDHFFSETFRKMEDLTQKEAQRKAAALLAGAVEVMKLIGDKKWPFRTPGIPVNEWMRHYCLSEPKNRLARLAEPS